MLPTAINHQVGHAHRGAAVDALDPVNYDLATGLVGLGDETEGDGEAGDDGVVGLIAG